MYDSQSEMHLSVLDCGVNVPYEYVGDIYLSREVLGNKISIDQLVSLLLKTDLDQRAWVYDEWQPPKGLHSTEGTPYGLKVQEYLDVGYAKAANCLVNNFRPGYVIRSFDNVKIKPSVQKGYVVLNKERVVVRIITEAVYVN